MATSRQLITEAAPATSTAAIQTEPRLPPQPQGSSEPIAPRASTRLLLLLAVTCGAMLWASYFPLACGWLAWAALVPLLCLARASARSRTIYLLAYLAGLIFYVPAIQWMRVADPRMTFTWLGLAIYCSLYFPVALWLVRLLERRTSLPLVLTLPVIWTALEYTRATFATGFSWYLLGHSQHDTLQVIQFADITGAWGVSFLVVAVNALLFEAIYLSPRARQALGRCDEPRVEGSGLLGQASLLGLAILGILLYGSWRLGQRTITPGPQLALIQGNVPQQLRNLGSNTGDPNQPRAAREVYAHYHNLSDLAVCYRPDLIVWPETSFPEDWPTIAEGFHDQAPDHWKENDRDGRDMARLFARTWCTSILVGLNAQIYQGGPTAQRYNSALLIDPLGNLAGMYHKMHRVPFGEYVPLRETFPWMNSLAPYDFDYSIASGTEHTRFDVSSSAGLFRFGTIICYEDTDPAVTIPYAGSDGKPPADFIINISNDGWFDGTSEHEQHLAICRFRAVECRRSVARSVNMGISAVIDSNGRVLRPQPLPDPAQLGMLGISPLGGSLCAVPWAYLFINTTQDVVAPVWGIPVDAGELPLSEWAQYKKVRGVLLANIPIDDRGSFYARWGDWLPYLCWTLLAAGLLLAFLRPRVAALA